MIDVDAGSILNIAAVAVSLIALGVSGAIAIRQIAIMRRSNQIPLFVELIQEFRSERFQRAELYIMSQLKESDAVMGVLALPDEARLAVTAVQSFFGTLGSLIIFGILDESETVAALGYRADQLWRKLEPFIAAERAIRGDDDFADFYEDFVCRTRANWPPEKRYNIKVRRLGALRFPAEDPPPPPPPPPPDCRDPQAQSPAAGPCAVKPGDGACTAGRPDPRVRQGGH